MAKAKKSNAVKDGWHKVRGAEIYVEDGRCVRAIKYDYNHSSVPAQVYYHYGRNQWANGKGALFTTVRSGIYKGTWKVL